jgi:hypothetical protein
MEGRRLTPPFAVDLALLSQVDAPPRADALA